MKISKTTLEQWQILQAVVEYGSFNAAAKALHKSQSTLSYNLAQLQSLLGVNLLEADGRRMKINAIGTSLLADARPLLEGMLCLEAKARILQQGWEAEIRLAVDNIYPSAWLLDCLKVFSERCTDTVRVTLHEVVMSGADEALFSGMADLVIGNRVPAGFLGDWLCDITFIAVARKDHPLHQLGRPLTGNDLSRELQVVVQDSGQQKPRDEGWLGAAQRWTVSSGEAAIAFIKAGLAFAWVPQHKILHELNSGELKPLALLSGQSRKAALYLILADPTLAGPATLLLADLFRQYGQE